jgi:hypothetical protein
LRASSERASSDLAGDCLDELLCAWRRDVRSVPMPVLIDSVRAADVIKAAALTSRVRASPDDARTRSRDL